MAKFGSILFILVFYAISNLSNSADICTDSCLGKVNVTEDVDSIGYCTRGCRLMQLIDSANDEGNLDVLLQMCLQSCDSAYGDDARGVIAACRFGCSSQLPLVKERRQQMAMLYEEAEQYVAMLQWVSSMMNCLNSRFQSGDERPSEGFYLRTRIIVLSSPTEDGAIGSVSMFGGPVAFVDEPAQRMTVENRLSRNSVVIIWGMTFFLLTVFTFSIFCSWCFSSKLDVTQNKKLSIYGDGEFLKTLDEADEELLLTDSKGGIEQPRVLLMKIPVHSI